MPATVLGYGASRVATFLSYKISVTPHTIFPNMSRLPPFLRLSRHRTFSGLLSVSRRRPVRILLTLSPLAPPLHSPSPAPIKISPPSSDASNEDLLQDLHSFFLDLIQRIRTLFRAWQLLIVATPLLLSYPFVPERIHFHILAWTLERAGPVCVKLGQWASTRRDLFPLDLCHALSKLQRRRHAHPWADTAKILDRHLHFKETFDEFEREPLGSGCCAQVHRARLRHPQDGDSTDVAVKVLHPQIKEDFERDLRVLQGMVDCLYWLVPGLKWMSLKESLGEFSILMKSQVDLRVEAKNLVKFGAFFEDQRDSIVFPRPVMRLCAKDLLVESFEEGVHMADFIEEEKVTEKVRKEIASLGVDMLLKMVFHDNFVHGDLHPGNILVRTDNSANANHQLVILDPGIVSTLSDRDLINFRQTFKAILTGDGRKVGELFLDRSKHECTDSQAFVSEMADLVLEARGQQLMLQRLNVSELLTKVFNTLMLHRVKLEANYASVILAIMVLEGLGRTLDPELDLIVKALPFLAKTSMRSS